MATTKTYLSTYVEKRLSDALRESARRQRRPLSWVLSDILEWWIAVSEAAPGGPTTMCGHEGPPWNFAHQPAGHRLKQDA